MSDVAAGHRVDAGLTAQPGLNANFHVLWPSSIAMIEEGAGHDHRPVLVLFVDPVELYPGVLPTAS